MAFLALYFLSSGCHPDAVAGSPAETSPETGIETRAANGPETEDGEAENSPGRAVPRDESIEAGDTGLLPILVPGVGPLTTSAGCDFDDPFSSCQ